MVIFRFAMAAGRRLNSIVVPYRTIQELLAYQQMPIIHSMRYVDSLNHMRYIGSLGLLSFGSLGGP